jgi:hypothetical protein
MVLEITLLLIDEDVTGFELGDISITDSESTISSANRNPSQSMMIFIFLSELLTVLMEMQTNRSKGRRVAISPNSSFFLNLEKKGANIIIGNGGVVIVLPCDEFLRLLYSEIQSLITNWQSRIKFDDSALRDLRKSMDRAKEVFKY